MFHALRTSFDRWRAVRKVRVLDRQFSDDYKEVFKAEIARAIEACDCGDHEKALTIWDAVRRRFPEQSMASKDGLRLLLDLGSFDEIDAMMQEGQRRYPHAEHFARGYAQSAHRRRDLQEALRRCEFLRKKFPRTAESYTIAAACLTDLGRHDEAEAMIGHGALKLPNDFELRMQHARNATRRHEWPEALRRWEVVKNCFEKQFVGPLGVAQCLREMGRFAEAEEVLNEACARFYQIDWIYAELADLATAKGDFDEAAQRWEALLRRSPCFTLGYIKGAEALRKIGREADADALLGVGVIRVQSDLPVHLQYARSADSRGDKAGAAKRWALVHERFPDYDDARNHETEAREAAARQKAGADARPC